MISAQSKLYLLYFECAHLNSNFEWALANRQQASNVDAADDRETQKVAPPQIWILRNPPDPQTFLQVSKSQ